MEPKDNLNFRYTGERMVYKNSHIQTYCIGTGDKIIFAFPSFPHSGFVYQLFTRFYDDTKYKFITFDLPGWGGWSHNIFADRPYDFYENVEIAKEVLRFYKVDRFSLMGYSFGGAMAIKLASEMLDRINKIVIVSGIVDSKIIEHEGLTKLVNLAWTFKAGWILKKSVMKKIDYYIKVLSTYLDNEILLEYKDRMSNANPRILLESVHCLFNADLRNEINSIKGKIPPLMIVSSQDEPQLFRNEAKFLVDELGASKVVQINGEHDYFILKPKSETVQQVMEFLLDGDYQVAPFHFPTFDFRKFNILSFLRTRFKKVA